MKKIDKNQFPAINSLLSSNENSFKFAQYLQNGGQNRERVKFNQLGTDDDLQAIKQFLDSVRDSPHTLKTYTKEIQRFLLWVLIEKQTSLSALSLDDFIAYEKFIESPSEHWCGVQGVKQTDANGQFNIKWRPFTGPLSANSQKIAIASINSMMNFLVSANYLSSNPLLLDKKHRKKLSKQTKIESYHALSNKEWQWIWEALENLPQKTSGEKNDYERLRFILTMFYCTACRIGEFSSHTMGSFKEHHNSKWYWHVLGKGDKHSILPANKLLLDALVRYRKHLNLSPLPDNNDKTPLLLNKSGKNSVSARQLSRILEKFYNYAANQVEIISPHSAENIRNATAHWLRHTALSHAAKRTQDLRLVKRFGRHEHIQTSMLYIHIDDEELENLITKQNPV